MINNSVNMDRFKFRFWHYEDKQIYNVLQLCANIPSEDFLRVFLDKPIENESQFTNWKTGIDGILMQSTGLKDKNGNLIYCGDILKDPLYKECPIFWKVIYSEYSGQLLESIEENPRQFYFYEHDFRADELKIIGNIHQNSELLNPTEEEE